MASPIARLPLTTGLHNNLAPAAANSSTSGGVVGVNSSSMKSYGTSMSEPPSSADMTAVPQQVQDTSSAATAESPGTSEGENFKVCIRVRPPLPRELDGRIAFSECVFVESDRSVTISDGSMPLNALDGTGVPPSPSTLEAMMHAESYGNHRFTFDAVYGPESHQEDVYESCAKPAVTSTLAGYNATMIAYGQTGTGKTFTMQGAPRGEMRGIIPRAIEDVFYTIESGGDTKGRFLVRAAYLQIYNEVIYDLLKPERTNLAIREDRRRGVFVEGLSEWVVRSPEAVRLLMDRGAQQRATGATRMNELSSRSHAVFVVVVENARGGQISQQAHGGTNAEDGVSVRVGKLNLVDLAGSERLSLSGAAGQRLEETKRINASLSALGNVISALTDPRGRPHVPYRDSKLTRLLTDSLGGNCKTTMICHVSPALEAFSEGLSTLKFASRAKQIRNEARVNEDLDQKAMLRKMELELRRLRSELSERSNKLVDKRKLLEVEEKRKQAEQDKLRAITELQNMSREILLEKQEKAELEERIKSLQSQLLVGGGAGDQVGAAVGSSRKAADGASSSSPDGGARGGGGGTDAARVRQLVKRENQRVRKEYESKLEALERERLQTEEDRAQIGRYKALLLKQRDIMIALTQRLAERDEHIGTLQVELEAYDERQRRLEDALDEKTVALISLRKAAIELGPNNDLDRAAAAAAADASALAASSKSASEMYRTGSDLSLHMHGATLVRGDSGAEHIPTTSSSSTTTTTHAVPADDGSVLARAASLPAPSLENSALEEENRALKAQAADHAKERAALRAILENKVAGLASNLAEDANMLKSADDGMDADRVESIGREARALQRLVAATVKALSQVDS